MAYDDRHLLVLCAILLVIRLVGRSGELFARYTVVICIQVAWVARVLLQHSLGFRGNGKGSEEKHRRSDG
jgi:hypothetical protein